MSHSEYKKFNTTLIFLIFLSSIGFILWLFFQPEIFEGRLTGIEGIKNFRFILGIPVLIMVTRFMILKRTWDYLLLNLGLWAFIFLFAFPEINNLLLAILHQTDNTHLWPIYYTAGLTIFALFFLLSSFFPSKPLKPQHYPLAIILANILGFLALISFTFITLLFADPLLSKNEIYPLIPLISILGQLFFLLPAGIKYLQHYFKKENRVFFWLSLASIFFMGGFSSYTLILLEYQVYSQLDHLFQTCALFCILMASFNEQYRFLEAETHIRNSLEKSLSESHDRLSQHLTLINEIPVGIFVLDPKGKIVFCNSQLCSILGYDRRKLIGENYRNFFDAGAIEKFEFEYQKWQERINSQIETEIIPKNKERLPVIVLSGGMLGKSGEYLGSRHVIVPISRWKEIEKDLKDRSENLEKIIQQRTAALKKKSSEFEYAKNYYETLISGMLDIMLVMDNQGRCTFINEYGQKLLGYTAEELSGKNLPEFYKDFRRLQKEYGKSVNLELHDYEHEVKTKAGETILCSWNVHLLPELAGKPMGVMFVGRNITEYKRLQSQLQNQTKNLEFLVERRTAELSRRVNQLNKIIQIGEDIILNLDLKIILDKICKATQTLGWNIVIIALRDFESNAIYIVSEEGWSEKKPKSVPHKKSFDFKEVLSIMRDDFLISHSYLIDHSVGIFNFEKSRLLKIPRIPRNEKQWHPGDSLLVPIKIKTKILGFIIVQDPQDNAKPDVGQTQILEIFANKAAVVIENARLYHEAKRQAGQMEKLSRLKSEFLANMSHELRTPLNSIITLTNILLKGLPGTLNTEQIKQIRIIEKNSQNLLRLINGLLDLSKIEAGKMEVHHSCFALRELISTIIETIKPLCAKKGLKLEVSIDKKIPTYIFSDADKISQVLINLLSNSVKFTDKGKVSLEFMSRENGTKLRMVIQDTGIGMSKADQAKIFQEFIQLEIDASQQAKGTGLGLTISKKMIEMLEGTIDVKSRAGHGTRFTIHIPLKGVGEENVARLEPGAGTGTVKLALTESEDGSQITLEETEPVPAEGRQSVPAARRPGGLPAEKAPRSSARPKRKNAVPHILLVDDNEDNRYAMSFFLKERGYQISFATNGQEGVNLAMQYLPDLILMDVMMPVMDGYEATRALKSKAEFKNIPIIAMTAKAMSYDRDKALRAGYDDYIAKPFTLENVAQKIDYWIQHAIKNRS